MLDQATDKDARHQRRGRLAVAISLVAVVAVLAGAVFGFFWLIDRVRGDSSSNDYAGPGSGRVVIEVAQGDSATAIARTLKEHQVVKSVDAFVSAAEANEQSAAIQPGFYALPTHLPAADALSAMLDPASRAETKVTLPEGLRLDETLKTLAAKSGIPLADFEKAIKTPGAIGLPTYAKGNPEGFLFPATYAVAPDATATDVLRQLTKRYDQAAQTVGLEAGAKLTPYQLVTIASLVEAEARHPEDFGKVARVVLNRLEKGMPLQFDSTVNYALKADKEIVLNQDLGVDSPYNTYKHAGLPPGPIGSPGEAALSAALNPPAGDWLYFVTVNPETGETKFTASYDEFLQFKNELKKNQGQ
jgi:UPF0755 protein